MALAHIDFFSSSLMRTMSVSAVLPTDRFERDADGRMRSIETGEAMKTLYLLHGVHGNCTDWISQTRIQRLAEERNIAVFMPSGDNSFYNDHADTNAYGEFIGRELVEFTRRTFRLSSAREDTAIGGLSMGGYGATINALRHPETFGHVIALSAAYMIDTPAFTEADDNAPNPIGRKSYLEACFGPLDSARGSGNDYLALAEQLASKGSELPRFFIACGLQDHLLESSRIVSARLVELGYDVEMHTGEGAHEWNFWDTWIERGLDWLPLDEAKVPISSGNVDD